MPVLQGTASYGPLRAILRASFTLGHGVDPSVATMEVAPQNVPVEGQTLAFHYAGTTIAFPNTKVDDARLISDKGGQRLSLRILDRRWKWRTGEINGIYNRRHGDGTLDTNYEKTPQELARLCLLAMGEAGFDVGALPNTTRPEVVWVAQNPAQALSDLASSLGCSIVLGIDNRVRIVRLGVGGFLPKNAGELTVNYGIESADVPDSIKVVCGRNLYQTAWLLEAVGRDTDNTIKPIDDLSYKPSNGWENESVLFFTNVLNEHGETAQSLARETVFRWYRIQQQAGGGAGRDRVLPIENKLLQTQTDPNTQQVQPKATNVAGYIWKGDKVADASNVELVASVDVPFQLNTELGIVEFADTVYSIAGNKPATTVQEANIWLFCSFGIRKANSLLWDRTTFEQKISGRNRGTGPLIIRREDLQRRQIATWAADLSSSRLIDNIEIVLAECRKEIAAKLLEFQAIESFEVTYGHILPLSPDGRIRQVSWSVGRSGATTRAGLNTEFALNSEGLDEKNQKAFLVELTKKQKQLQKKLEADGDNA